MDASANLNQIFYPSNLNELFNTWTRFPNAVPYAGGTDIIGRQGKNILSLPNLILSLDKLPELHRITRTEQYLEIGAMVNLNRLIRLGKIVPSILVKCLENIAGVQVRNLATVGGNICGKTRIYDLHAPLTALDAQYEIRSPSNTKWIPSSRFLVKDPSTTSPNILEKQELLTRIRLPLHHWDFSIYKKFMIEDNFYNETLIFLARAQKNLLTDIRVVYKAKSVLRNKNGEDLLNGKILPINRRTVEDFVQNWREFLSEKDDVSDFSKNALLKSIEENVFLLSE